MRGGGLEVSGGGGMPQEVVEMRPVQKMQTYFGSIGVKQPSYSGRLLSQSHIEPVLQPYTPFQVMKWPERSVYHRRRAGSRRRRLQSRWRRILPQEVVDLQRAAAVEKVAGSLPQGVVGSLWAAAAEQVAENLPQ